MASVPLSVVWAYVNQLFKKKMFSSFHARTERGFVD